MDIINVKVFEDRIEITTREKSNSMYACYPAQPVPDTIYKEIYGIKDNKIVLLEKLKGEHIPTQIISEQFRFDK